MLGNTTRRMPTALHGCVCMRDTRMLSTAPAVSHVIGDTSIPLIEESIGRFFLKQAEIYSDHELLVDIGQMPKVSRSWSDLADESMRVGCELRSRGFLPGDRVGVWLPNCHEWVVTQLACHLAGIVLVNVNPAYRSGELRHALNLVGAKGLVVLPHHMGSDYAALLKEARSEEGGIPSLSQIFSLTREGRSIPGASPFHELLSAPRVVSQLEDLEAVTRAIRPDEVAYIQFTSGTTGAPKAAALTHRGILNNGAMMGHLLNYGPDDRVCVPVPLYHCFGCVMGTLACIVHGSTIVLPAPGFDAATTLDVVASEKCTSLYGVPTMFNAMVPPTHHLTPAMPATHS